jgi:hypothetical protein
MQCSETIRTRVQARPYYFRVYQGLKKEEDQQIFLDLIQPVVECVGLMVLGCEENERAFEQMLKQDFLAHCRKPRCMFVYFFIKMITREVSVPLSIF